VLTNKNVKAEVNFCALLVVNGPA
jgi:Reverse transcriptase (RNA-dependent DNA polymerase)